MGRAFQVRKAAMEKTAAAKTKVYSRFGREIYVAAKEGVPDPEMNTALRRTIERAKKAQVPADIIKRAIDKAKSGVADNFTSVTYEGFGPGASTVIVECSTDNTNRAYTDVRNAFTKSNSKLGVPGCASHSYEHVALVGVKGLTEDQVLEALLMAGVDVNSVETEEDLVMVYGEPTSLKAIKNAIDSSFTNFEIEVDEVTYIAQDLIKLNAEDMILFKRLNDLLDASDDVQNVYHNVNLED